MKVLLATENFTERPNEGLLVFALHLSRFLDRECELTVVYNTGEVESTVKALKLLSKRMILTHGLLKLLKNDDFDAVIYLPASGLTAFGLARCSILKTLSGCPMILITLQERIVGSFHRFISLSSKPDLVLTPVANLRSDLKDIGLRTGFLMPGYDGGLFRSVDREEKSKLREKYDLPRDKFIILHVGHIKESRNLQVFLRYRDWGADIQPVVKGGDVDPAWRDRLRMAGVIVIDEYIENVQELYQASDCYLFPVFLPTGALDFPLSVIEAAACNLPVLTTPFGVLPQIITEGDGICYFENPAEVPVKLSRIREITSSTSKKVEGFQWNSVFSKYLMPHLLKTGSIPNRGRS